MLTKFKVKIQSWLVAEAKFAHSLGLTPNILSITGVFFSALSGLAYWFWRLNPIFLVAAPILLLSSGFCDALDGVLARFYGKTTIFGGFLDSLFDRYSDAAILVGIILGGLCDVFWGLIALTGSFLVSYSRARAEALGGKMESIGIAERAERLILITLASFASIFWLQALRWGIIVLAMLSNITVIQRLFHFLRSHNS